MKRLVSILISVAVLAIIYWQIDVRTMFAVFRSAHIGWLVAGLLMVVPLALLTAWRFQQVIPAPGAISMRESLRLVLIASVLNMILPSKMGDIAKAYFIKDRSRLDRASALSLVVYDKAWDMLSLLVWCLLGLVFYPQKNTVSIAALPAIAAACFVMVAFLASQRLAQRGVNGIARIAPRAITKRMANLTESWVEIQKHLFTNKQQLARVALASMLIWLLHLTQIWMFTRVVRSVVPFVANLALAPLSILAGLLPLTFAGVGTRDAAIILFYGPYMTAAAGAALGLLCTSRYLSAALIGLPFLTEALTTARRLKRQQPSSA